MNRSSFITLVLSALTSVQAHSTNQVVLPKLHLLDDAGTVRVDAEAPNLKWKKHISGRIMDQTGAALPEAFLSIENRLFKSDLQGFFSIDLPNESSGELTVKKAGFRKVTLGPQTMNPKITLVAQTIAGIYVQAGVFKNLQSPVMAHIEHLLGTTELNAVVVDFKDDDGHVIQGLQPFVDRMHAMGIYVIARVVAFKDNTTALKDPTFALTDMTTGLPWKNSKNTSFLNPFDARVRKYVVNVALQAVDQHFDEIEFDYVRFPDGGTKNVLQLKDSTADTRTSAIAGFLLEAQKALGAKGAFVAADVFGDTADVAKTSDSGIGQRIGDITQFIDYVCPMVYPSGYAAGMNGFDKPTNYPGEMVGKEIRRYRVRAGPSVVIRPWLQAFRDYAFDRQVYGGKEIRAQIDGSNANGGVGFLLWNASNRYTGDGLNRKAPGLLQNKPSGPNGLL